jgi:hypothetical protein
MEALGPQRLLEVWERGVRSHPIDRALLLFALAEPARASEQLADLPLSRRNAALMALRLAWFGNPLPVWCDCPACGERMELTIDTDQLPERPGPQATEVEIDGLRFRAPTSRHLAALVNDRDPDEAARRLLAACAESPESIPAEPQRVQALLSAVDAAFEQADPWLDLSLQVTCPDCGEGSEPSLDIPAVVWDELDAVARRLLDEVHILARSYGWHERDILGMSEQRRAAYLDRLQA